MSHHTNRFVLPEAFDEVVLARFQGGTVLGDVTLFRRIVFEEGQDYPRLWWEAPDAEF